jgi:Tfp pilus assembly protein PilZ
MEERQIINLSDGGVGFNGNFAVQTQNSFGYIMCVLDSHPVPLFIRGEFVYCIPTTDQVHSFKIGFKFDKEQIECGDIIKEYVQKKLAEKNKNSK